MKFLVDTCTFLWILSAGRQISDGQRRIIIDPQNEIFISPISFWEIFLKNQNGKLDLPTPVGDYLVRGRIRHGLIPLPVSEESLLHLPKLPSLHRDPFDRLLICQAMEHGLCLITPDPAIMAYPVKTMWN